MDIVIGLILIRSDFYPLFFSLWVLSCGSTAVLKQLVRLNIDDCSNCMSSCYLTLNHVKVLFRNKLEDTHRHHLLVASAINLLLRQHIINTFFTLKQNYQFGFKWRFPSINKCNINTLLQALCCVHKARNKKRPKEKHAFLRAARDRAVLANVTQSVSYD